jgi:urea carboxylase-associated protein 1
MGEILEELIVPTGAPWSGIVHAGETLRLVDLEGQQAVDFICYDVADPSERYDCTVTARIAGRVYVREGDVLYSNLANPLMTITADSVGWHDTIAGCCSREINKLRYNVDGTKSCRENFLTLVAKHDLSPRDIVPNVNFFMYVPVDAAGRISIAPSASKPGDTVDLRAERDVLVLLSNCPQSLNAANGFRPTPIRVALLR